MTSFLIDALTICTYVAAAVFAIGIAMHLWARNYKMALICADFCIFAIVIGFLLGGLS